MQLTGRYICAIPHEVQIDMCRGIVFTAFCLLSLLFTFTLNLLSCVLRTIPLLYFAHIILDQSFKFIYNLILQVPEPRPGSCHNDSRTLPDLTLNFIKTHSLMDENVPAFFGSPILIRTSTMWVLTEINYSKILRQTRQWWWVTYRTTIELKYSLFSLAAIDSHKLLLIHK